MSEMDFDSSIKLMFPNGIPDSWIDNPDFSNYLSKLGLYNISKLGKELDHLSAEKAAILNQTQELAFANYKTFIQTAECSREIFQQFQKCEQSLESLVQGVPKFSEECEEFVRRCGQIKAERQVNSITLARHSSILQLLEVPQLMDTAVREGLYDEALSLASYVRRLATLHSNIPVIKKLCSEIDACWSTLTKRLIWELHGELQLPRCLQVVGVLRRMGVMSDAELRLKFLHARDSSFYNLISRIPNEQRSQRLNKIIEVYRTQLFNIITQYRAVFPELDSIITTSKQHFNEYPVLHEWINNKVCELISTVEREASEGRCDVSSIEQVMYLGQSLGRVGVDVRGLAGPVFSRSLCRMVGSQLSAADHRFVADMDRFSLESVKGVTTVSPPFISHLTSTVQQSTTDQQHHLKCEVSSVEYYPLARYTNSLLSVLNQLRLCAPLCLAQPVTDMLQQSLQSVASSIAQFYTREQQAMSAEERDLLTKMVVCFNDYLVPYIQRCLQSVYSPAEISFFLSVPVFKLQEKGLTFFNMSKISTPIQHLLPIIKLDLASSQYLEDNPKDIVQTDAIKDSKIVQEKTVVT